MTTIKTRGKVNLIKGRLLYVWSTVIRSEEMKNKAKMKILTGRAQLKYHDQPVKLLRFIGGF